MTRHRPTRNDKPPNHWRIFHRFDPYRDNEERRDAERALARQESNAFRKALAFAHKNPKAKLSQIMQQSQTRRAKSDKYTVALPPPFPKRP